jgi:ATP synthase F1 epsilon subunit
MPLLIRILTPDRIFREDEVDEVILPTSTGQMGVLRAHAPLITALDIGPMITRSKEEWEALALMGGFALIQDDRIVVLVNEAIGASAVGTKTETKERFDKARKNITRAKEQRDRVEAAFLFKRARARYQVARWKGGRET